MSRKKKPRAKTFGERYGEAQQKMAAIRQRMYFMHPGFHRAVFIVHQDGTTLFFQNAFAVVEGPVPDLDLRDELERRTAAGESVVWPEEAQDHRLLAVFTEHNGYHLFALDDLLRWHEFQHVEGPIAKSLDEVAEQAERVRKEYHDGIKSRTYKAEP